jgi:hypothetical protein
MKHLIHYYYLIKSKNYWMLNFDTKNLFNFGMINFFVFLILNFSFFPNIPDLFLQLMLFFINHH